MFLILVLILLIIALVLLGVALNYIGVFLNYAGNHIGVDKLAEKTANVFGVGLLYTLKSIPFVLAGWVWLALYMEFV